MVLVVNEVNVDVLVVKFCVKGYKVIKSLIFKGVWIMVGLFKDCDIVDVVCKKIILDVSFGMKFVWVIDWVLFDKC